MVDCPICGQYTITREAYDDFLDKQSAIGSRLSHVERSRIAHKVKRASADAQRDRKYPAVTSDLLEGWKADGFRGPTPAEQATNLIRFIGEEIGRTGQPVSNLPDDFFAIIGAPSPTMAGSLLVELKDRGFIDGIDIQTMGTPPNLAEINMTLAGWSEYEREQKGEISGRYGFLAMQFGAASLETLVRDAIKPALKEHLSLELQDMRDVARAGVIDNIMRAQIRDAAFVVVDLTHDNPGAYWEAGYAKGLGKPVIYICEKTKFDEAKTHFDTNHCTTVVWSGDDSEHFVQELVATLRRSLNLF